MLNSCLRHKYDDRAKMMEVNEREAVKSFGDMELEYNALRNGAMFYDCSSFGLFMITGEDSCDFLEKLATKEVQFLNVEGIVECYFLNENAEVEGSVFIQRNEDDFIIIAPWECANAVKEWLSLQLSKGEWDAKMKDLSGEKSVLSIEGFQSWKVLKDILSFEIENVSLRMSAAVSFEDEEINLIRAGRTTEYSYMIISSVAAGEKLYDMLLAKQEGYTFPVSEGGYDCLELAMLEVRQPNFLKETYSFGNLLELGQQWLIQFDKEDYIGREQLMELFHQGTAKNTVGFVSEHKDTAFQTGDKVFAGGECVGQVIYSIYSIGLQKPLGIAILDHPYGQSGLDFELKGEDGTVFNIKTLSAPYVKPASWDAKME